MNKDWLYDVLSFILMMWVEFKFVNRYIDNLSFFLYIIVMFFLFK